MVASETNPDEPTDSEVAAEATDAGDDFAADRRRAAWVATLVAVPVTLAVGAGAFWLVGSPETNAQEPATLPVPSDPVPVDVIELSDSDATYCRALISVVPEDLGDLPQRAVSGDAGAAELTAAWGEPATVLRCGVEPVEAKAAEDVYRLGASCWLATQAEEAVVWTSLDRTLPVEVAIPAAYDEPGQLVQALSEPVAEKIPAIEDTPSGCSG